MQKAKKMTPSGGNRSDVKGQREIGCPDYNWFLSDLSWGDLFCGLSVAVMFVTIAVAASM